MRRIKIVKVIATKLDPNADYLIVFNQQELSMAQMSETCRELVAMGHRVVGQYCLSEPEKALKVYQIPKKGVN